MKGFVIATLVLMSLVSSIRAAETATGDSIPAMQLRFRELASEFDGKIASLLPKAEKGARAHLSAMRTVIDVHAATYTTTHFDAGQVQESVSQLQILLGWIAQHPDGDAARWQIQTFISNWDQTLQFAVLRRPRSLQPDQRYPLIIALEGAGNPNPLYQLLEITRPENDHEGPEQPYFFLKAWRRGNVGYSEGSLDNILQSLKITLREHPIAPDRVSLLGNSMGGGGVWRLALRHPDLWNAVALECPAPPQFDPMLGDPTFLPNATGFPWRFWGGGKDPLRPAGESMRVALAKVGAQVVNETDPEFGHGFKVEARNANLRWLLAQPPAPNPAHFTFVCRGADSGFDGIKALSCRGVAMQAEFDGNLQQNLSVDISDTQVSITTTNTRRIFIDPVRLGIAGKARSVVWNGETVREGAVGNEKLSFGDRFGPIKLPATK